MKDGSDAKTKKTQKNLWVPFGSVLRSSAVEAFPQDRPPRQPAKVGHGAAGAALQRGALALPQRTFSALLKE